MAAELRASIVRLLSIVRSTSFDTSDAVGRSKERYRRVFFTTTTSAIARVVQIVASLLTVPLTLRYLGPELYGLWLTMSSVMAMFAFADLGVGNGLLLCKGRKGKSNWIYVFIIYLRN